MNRPWVDILLTTWKSWISTANLWLGLGLCCLTSLSTIFQLQRGVRFLMEGTRGPEQRTPNKMLLNIGAVASRLLRIRTTTFSNHEKIIYTCTSCPGYYWCFPGFKPTHLLSAYNLIPVFCYYWNKDVYQSVYKIRTLHNKQGRIQILMDFRGLKSSRVVLGSLSLSL